MKILKKFRLGLMVLSAMFIAQSLISPAKSALAAIAGFNAAQIQGASTSSFSFTSGGNIVNGTINNKPVQFTSNTTTASMVGLAKSCANNPSCAPIEWKPNPSDLFCEPGNWSEFGGNTNWPGPYGTRQPPQSYPDQLILFPQDIKLNSSQTTIVSATMHLIAFGGTTNAGCDQATAGNRSSGVTLTVNMPVGAPTGTVVTQSSVNGATYKFGANGSIINGTFKLADGSSTTVQFVDQQPYDNTPNFVATSSTDFCGSTTPNITLANWSGDPPATIKIASLSMQITTDAVGDCAAAKLPASGSGVSVDDSEKAAGNIFQWQGNTLQSFGNKSVLTLSDDSKVGTGSNQDRIYDDGSGCGAGSGWVVLLTSAQANSGQLFHLSSGSGTVVNGAYTGCQANSSTPKSITITGSWSQQVSTGGGTTGAVDCESQAATSGIAGQALAFVACPMLDAAQSFSDWLIGQVENLLSFTFANNLGSKTIDPTTGKSQYGNVQNAWSQMRDLASVFLVIIMLVMVLSQAVSWGPFDAYTVRKVLPKLVIAVIAMQLSWSLLQYITHLFDDFGHGIADLLYGPFGGPSALQLGTILQQAGIQAYAGGSVVLVSLIGIAAIAVLSLPTILLVGWSIVLALLVAWVTLAVRQIFIIALIIFAPIAFLAWILPGTQKYWKMWYDNFTKLMLMFPMIIGMIAVGRIFALITSSGSNDKLVKFVLIMIGYFGTFFFIPKTFKWGGAAMGAASGALSNVAPKLGGPMTNYLKGAQERSFWNKARQARKNRLGDIATEKYGASLADRDLRTRVMHLGLSKNREVLRRATISAQAEQRKLLQQRAEESVAPLVEGAVASGNWSAVTAMATNPNGTAQDRAAAMSQLAINRRFGDITRAGIHTTPQWEQLYNTNKDVKDAVDGGRIDLKPSNMRAGTAGQLAIGPAPGTSGVEGVSMEQLGAQSADFFNLADSGIAAGSDLDTYVGRLQEMARTPNAPKIMGTDKETAINATLQRHHVAHGGTAATAPTFTSLVQQARVPTPPPTPMPALAPVVTAGAAPGEFNIGTQPMTPLFQAIHNEPAAATDARATAAGGWDAYAGNPATVDQVVFVAQNKQGALRDAARTALQNRGITLPPT